MHALTVLVGAASVDAVSDLLSDDHGALSVSIEDADAGSPDEQPVFDEPGIAQSGGWRRARLSALFGDEAAATAAAAALAASDLGRDARIEAIAAVDERDWVRLTQAQFGPTEIEPGFWIVPTWSAVPADARRVIRLDPGMAFGTGTHPTTRMCLRWIARQVRGIGGTLVARARLRLRLGRAGDRRRPVRRRRDRRRRHRPRRGRSDRRQCLGQRGGAARRHGRQHRRSERFDLILANILATPLKLLAPLLSTRLAPAGTLVLSGILSTQATELRAAYAPWLALEVADEDDGWILMTGVRPSPDRVA